MIDLPGGRDVLPSRQADDALDNPWASAPTYDLQISCRPRRPPSTIASPNPRSDQSVFGDEPGDAAGVHLDPVPGMEGSDSLQILRL